jgi:4-oxalocrotonate tautomerase
MPIITINMLEGRDAERKRRLLRDVTAAVSAALDAPPETIRILLQEYPREHWAVGGTSKAESDAAASARNGPTGGVTP